VAFRKRFADAEVQIPPEGIGPRGYKDLLLPLVAQVGDGHTELYAWSLPSSNASILIDLLPIEEHLVVASVHDPKQRSAIGAILEAIEGIPVTDLVQRMGARKGFENIYTNLQHLAEAAASTRDLAGLLERPSLGDFVVFTVRLPSGARADLQVPISSERGWQRLEAPSLVRLPAQDGAKLAAGFLDDACTVGYFGMGSAMDYREAFEDWRSSGNDKSSHLDNVLRRVTGQDPTGDTEHKIAQIPAVTECLIRLFTEMKAHRTPILIIDMRENEGGNSLFTGILEYFLYPLDTIFSAGQGYQVRRYSALYFQNYPGDTLDKVRARTSPDFQLGDLDFSQQLRWRASRTVIPSDGEKAQWKRQYAENQLERAPTFGRAVKENRWNASWSPRVLVLSSARTYSAAFDAVLTLRAHGATVVGVPSSQAANCFIDTLHFQLTHSQAQGGLSYKWSVRLPEDLKAGSLLRPDLELTYERFEALHFDPNATVLLALEMALGKPWPSAGSQSRQSR